jgi:exopolysaccharide production protein ExoQ
MSTAISTFSPTITRTKSLASAPWMLISLLVLVFFTTEFSPLFTAEDYDLDSAELKETSTADGSPVRRVMFVLLGAVGIGSWYSATETKFKPTSLLASLMIGLLAWSLLSVAWAHDVGMCLRRVFVLALFAVGALGVSRRLSLQELVWCTFWVCLTFLVAGLLLEVRFGVFKPWSSEYRFSGSLHPNQQGLNCGALAIAAWYLSRGGRADSYGTLLRAIAIAAILMLFLTRSRSAFGAYGGAVVGSWLLRLELRNKLLWLAYGVAVACAGFLVLDSDLGDTLLRVLMMGREDRELTGSLTGRVPLWEELWNYYASDHWLLGYGFNSFWVPAHIEAVSESQNWAISEAHNAYLEMLLGTGMVGAILFAVILCLGTGVCVCRSRRSWSSGYSFGASILLLCALNGLLESSVGAPRFIPFVAGCILLHAAFIPVPSTLDGAPRDSIYSGVPTERGLA